MKHGLQGTLRRLVVAFGVAVLAAIAAGFALAALYIFTAGVLGILLAAVVTAGGALVLAGLISLGGLTCRATYRGLPRRRVRESDDPGEIAARWLRHNAKKATIVALVTGVAFGFSPELRRSFLRLLGEFRRL